MVQYNQEGKDEEVTMTTVPVSWTFDELWLIQQLVRETNNYGAEWDRDDMMHVHAAILNLLGRPSTDTEILDMNEGFLWQIENQVPQNLDLGRSNIGRSILSKVFKALQVVEEQEDAPEDVPAVFRDAYAGEDVPVADSDPGAPRLAW